MQKLQGAVPRNGRGNGLFSLRTYLRIVSSGASTVASTVRSAGASVASSIAERYEEAIRDQVLSISSFFFRSLHHGACYFP